MILVGVVIVAVVHGGRSTEDLVRELVDRDTADASPDALEDGLSRRTRWRVANREDGHEGEIHAAGPAERSQRQRFSGSWQWPSARQTSQDLDAPERVSIWNDGNPEAGKRAFELSARHPFNQNSRSRGWSGNTSVDAASAGRLNGASSTQKPGVGALHLKHPTTELKTRRAAAVSRKHSSRTLAELHTF